MGSPNTSVDKRYTSYQWATNPIKVCKALIKSGLCILKIALPNPFNALKAFPPPPKKIIPLLHQAVNIYAPNWLALI